MNTINLNKIDTNTKIKHFNRNTELEFAIDKEIINNSLSNGFALTSISTYLNHLDEHITAHNSDVIGKTQLLNFLRFHSRSFDYPGNLSSYSIDYINSIKEYVDSLKAHFDFIPPQNVPMLEVLCQELIRTLVDNKGFNSFIQRYTTHIAKKDYGFVLFSQRFNFICLVNDKILEEDLKSFPTVILYHENQFSNDFVYELFKDKSVMHVVIYDDNKNKRYYSHDRLGLLYEPVFRSLLEKVSKSLQNDNSLGYLYDLSNRMITKLTHFDDNFHYLYYCKKPKKFKNMISSLIQLNSDIRDELLRLERNNSSDRILFEYTPRLDIFSDNLSAFFDRYFNINRVDDYLNHSLSKIRKNKFLYRRKEIGAIHDEENLSSILKTLLEFRFNNSTVQITQEEINGAGFSDIEIKFSNKTIAIIECKLIKAKSNKKEPIKKGLDQLIARYGKHDRVYIDSRVTLYLVVFTVDSTWEANRIAIVNAVEDYCARTDYTFEFIKSDAMNGIHLVLRDNCLIGEFNQRSIDVTIVLCELEDNTKNNDRLRNKAYNPNRQK